MFFSEDALEGWFRVDGKYVGRLVYILCIVYTLYSCVLSGLYTQGGMYKGRLYCPAGV